MLPMSPTSGAGAEQVRYSDRFVEELHLPVEVLSFASEQPQVSPTSAINAARLAAAGAAASEAQVRSLRIGRLGGMLLCCALMLHKV